MKINKLLVLAALPMIGLTANAQDKGPQKNDFTVAATVSYNNTVMQNAAVGTLPATMVSRLSQPTGMTSLYKWESKVAGSSSTNGNWYWEEA